MTDLLEHRYQLVVNELKVAKDRAVTAEALLADQPRLIEEVEHYRKHLAYLLKQPWYVEHLPEIRQHVETFIRPNK